MAEKDRVSLRLARDPHVHAEVEAVGETLLRLYDHMIAWTVVDRTDDDRQGQQLALAYYFGKIQRTTRLALTGILAGQGREAMPLLREQFEYTLRFEYYKYFPHEALLFALTQARLKVGFAKEIMVFDPIAAADPKRIEQHHPDLMRPTKRSEKGTTKKMVPWSEPSAETLCNVLMERWLTERSKEDGSIVTAEKVRRYAARMYFYRGTAQSQAKHGTAFNISEGLEFDRLGNLNPVESQVDDPNGLAWLLLQNALPLLKVYAELVLGRRGTCFEAQLIELADASEALRLALQIPLEPPWP
jgi:hypothetical protein